MIPKIFKIAIFILLLVVIGCEETSVYAPPVIRTGNIYKQDIPDPEKEYFTIMQYDFNWKENNYHSTWGINGVLVKLQKATIIGWSMKRDRDYLFLCDDVEGFPKQDSFLVSIDPVIEYVDSLNHLFYFNINGKHSPFVVGEWLLPTRLLPVHPIWGYPFKNSDYHLSVWVSGYIVEPVYYAN